MMLRNLLWVSAVLLLYYSSSTTAKDRKCCRYRCDKNAAAAGKCPSWCQSSHSCVLHNGSQIVEDGECEVTVDTKKDDQSLASKVECYKQNFRSRETFDELPFYLEAYTFLVVQGESPLTGIELKYKYSSFNLLSFRLMNIQSNVCPSNSIFLPDDTFCNPRCVTIEKGQQSLSSQASLATDDLYLSYDCEVGFYISRSETSFVIDTFNNEYKLSVCRENGSSIPTCGEYLFLMPNHKTLNESLEQSGHILILLDYEEFEKHETIVLHIPTSESVDQFLLTLHQVDGNDTKMTDIYHQFEKVTKSEGSQRVELTFSLSTGRYQVSVTGLKDGVVVSRPVFTPHITVPNYTKHLLFVLLIIGMVVLFVMLCLFVYKRWQKVAEEGAIEPCELVEAGRIQPKPVFIITSLNNSQHIEIVKELTQYLKNWCGVGDTYFPLDDQVGIQTGQRDPWKWCQDSYNTVRDEGGSIIFIAGPDQALPPSITPLYPGIQENQAFQTTKDLRQMSQQGRVLVCKFTYSNVKTLPTELPQHLVSSAYLLPRQMNAFLSQLLQVKRKTLSPLVPFSLVQPEILPADMARQGGKQILNNIRQLTIKEQKFQAEQSSNSHQATILRMFQTRFIDNGGSSGSEPDVARTPIYRPANNGKVMDLGAAEAEREPLYNGKEMNEISTPTLGSGTERSAPNGDSNGRPANDTMELEAGMPSLRDMANRDRATHDELT